MKFSSKIVLASALTLSVGIGGLLALKTTAAEAKSSILYCGSPGPKNCNPYPYKPHGGRGSICAKYSPCYLSSDCTGDQVCDTQRPPNAK
jgi:hypothetical protein